MTIHSYAWTVVKNLFFPTLGHVEVFDSDPVAVATHQGDERGLPKIDGGIRSQLLYTPVPGAIANGPIDGVLVEETCTITAQLVDDGAAVAGITLAGGVWHPMQATHITATSATSGKVLIGWLRKHA